VVDPDNGWCPLTETLPLRDGFDEAGEPGWQRPGYRDDYHTIVASIADYAGERGLLRATFRANMAAKAWVPTSVPLASTT
jgi:hypothetical protein